MARRFFTDEEVRSIRREYARGVTLGDLAALYVVSPLTIRGVVRGETYGHLDFREDEQRPASMRTKGRPRSLTEDDVRNIRSAIWSGDDTYERLANYYKVTPGMIYKIVSRQAYRDVEWTPPAPYKNRAEQQRVEVEEAAESWYRDAKVELLKDPDYMEWLKNRLPDLYEQVQRTGMYKGRPITSIPQKYEYED